MIGRDGCSIDELSRLNPVVSGGVSGYDPCLTDKLASEHGVTKLRTVGDGYLAVTGIMADMAGWV